MSEDTTLSEVLDWLYAGDPLADAAVEAKTRLILLDTLGCAIAALRHPEPRALIDGLEEIEAGPVRLPGLKVSLSPASAAFALALGACWDEACEGLARAHGRPGLHAAPAALALARARQADLGSVLQALVVGYEVGGRMGEVLRIKPGMHVDGAWGALAAAAAAARLLSPDVERCRTAIEIAASQIPFSLYAPVAAGATARNTYVGHGVTLGIYAAHAAVAGVTAPPDAISDYRRLALGLDEARPDLAPPGEFLILQGYLKPHAAVRHVHYGVECALKWRRCHGGGTAEISKIRLRIYDEALRYCGNRAPATAIQAQFSLSYGLARALLAGDLGPDAYTAEALREPEVRRLEALVELQSDPELTVADRRGACLTVSEFGHEETVSVAGIPGDPDRPLDETAVSAKFRSYASPILGDEVTAALATSLLHAPRTTAINVALQSA